MAWTLQLLNDDTTLSLNDGTAYSARPGFLAPPPPVRTARGGANLFRHGSDMTERVYANRRVTVTLRIHGTSQDNLIANILAVNRLLERAAEYTTHGLGSQVKLRRQWENATNQVDFYVLSGTLTLGDEFSPVHTQNTTFANAVMRLTCEPFAYGAEESVENYVLNAGFEVWTGSGSALVEWTESITATGSSALTNTVSKNGATCCKLVMTDSGGSGQVVERSQVLLDVTAGQVWSFQCWVRVDELTDCKVVMELDYNTGTDVEVSTTTVNASEFVKLTANNNTVPGSVTQVTLRLRLESAAANATGTVYIDNVIAVQAAAVPVAWTSSRSIANHYDLDVVGQLHTNHIDIHDVPGDVPALLQVRVAEAQAHTEFWAGARHAGRQQDVVWLQGFRFIVGNLATPANTSWDNTDETTADATGGKMAAAVLTKNSGTVDLAVDTYVGFRETITAGTLPKGTFRVLAIVGWEETGTTGADPTKLEFGLGYGYGAFELLDTANPVVTSFVALPSTSTTEVRGTILDLGTITLPPIASVDGMSDATLTLRIFAGTNDVIGSFGSSDAVHWYLDSVVLMPIDYGSIYLSKTSAADVILMDSMSRTKGAYILDASDVVQSFPSNQLGRSPEAHPDGTRIYILAQSAAAAPYTIGDTFTVSITYRPRFLHVMGA